MFRKPGTRNMKPFIGLVLSGILVFSGVQASASPQVANLAAGDYIVTFRASTDVAGEVSRFKARKGWVERSFNRVFRGMAVTASTADLRALQLDPDVVAIEPDLPIQVDAVQNNVTWGLDRIDQNDLPLNTTYSYTSTGAGVKVFVVDTGLLTSHNEFRGRVLPGQNFAPNANRRTLASDVTDCDGHGTHVAGTIAGTTYGVAKQASIVPVRVLDCSGSGSTSGVIAGLNWVAGQVPVGTKAVVSMSIGGGFSSALNSAVQAVINKGATVVVAAGNESSNACSTSPASAPNAVTVGATDSSDFFAGYSNNGSCVDILAPGSRITSAWIGSSSRTNNISGTSMATPHVSGVAALMLQDSYKTPAEINALLSANAVSNTISNVPAGTVNKFLNTTLAPAEPVLTPATQTVSIATGQNVATQVLVPANFSTTPIFALTGGTLPAGLSFNSSTGVISGSPTATKATTIFTITATAGSQTASTVLSLTVSAPLAALSVNAETVVGTVGTVLATSALTATNFVGAVTFSITAGGVLPAGLSLNTSTGVISGVPTAPKTITTYTITGSGATSGSATANRTITVNPYIGLPSAPISVTAASSSRGRANLSWAVGSDGGSQLRDVVIRVYNTANQLVRTTSTSARRTSTSVSGLNPGVSYYFTVSVTNRNGSSTATTSNTITAIR